MRPAIYCLPGRCFRGMLPRRIQRLVDAVPKKENDQARELVENYSRGRQALALTRDAVQAGSRGIRGLWASLTGVFVSRDTHVPSDRFLRSYARFALQRSAPQD